MIEPKSPRIISWDLESTSLTANWGYILAFGWKLLGTKKASVVKLTDFPLYKKEPTNDKELVRVAAQILGTADIWVTWYGKGFDVKLLNSKLVKHGLPPLPPIPHVDCWETARYKLKLNSNRLAAIAEFFELEQKTPLSSNIWVKAQAGDKKSLNYIYEHCSQDVIVLEQAYNKLRPLMTNHPNVNLVDQKTNACPICGVKDQLQKRGFTIARSNKYQRIFCTACGGWSKARVAVKLTNKPEFI